MAIKRRNKLDGQWSAVPIDMQESPAFMVLSLSAHRVMSRIQIELAHHGGNDNGQLPVTYDDFCNHNIDRAAVAPAIRELEALGFIRVTQRGYGGNAEHRQPNKFLLTYLNSKSSRSPPHDWRKVKNLEEARAIAKAARNQKNELAVSYGRRRAARKNQWGKPAPKPMGERPTEAPKAPMGETHTTGSVGKPTRLSISRGGGGAAEPSVAISTALAARKVIPIPGYPTVEGEAQRANPQGAQARTPSSREEDDLTIPVFLRRPYSKQGSASEELPAFDRNNMQRNECS